MALLSKEAANVRLHHVSVFAMILIASNSTDHTKFYAPHVMKGVLL